MTVRAVLKMGDPRLLRQARPVEQFGSEALLTLIEDLHETMATEGGVGLAAPQIGVDLAVVVFGFEQSARYPDAAPVPRTVLINPVIELIGNDVDSDWEGCLSIPGLRGMVPRARSIRYRGFDPSGAPIDRLAEGFHARVVQHECDHLLGTLYPMRMTDMRRFGYTDMIFPELQARDD